MVTAIVFSHGWPLSADDWDAKMLFFVRHGYRVIAHDRRGHGRSTQSGDGHDMDHYADDLAVVTTHLDLKNAIHVGHSTGGGEVARYLGRHGERRVARAVLSSAVPPLMASAPLSADLLKNGTLKTYKGFPHGMCTTEADTINADLLASSSAEPPSDARGGSSTAIRPIRPSLSASCRYFGTAPCIAARDIPPPHRGRDDRETPRHVAC